MIKVVNIISDTNIGGAGKCVINFAKNYDKKKYDLCIVLPKGSALIEELKKTSAKIIEINGLKDKSWDLKALFPLIKVLRQEKPDIVHAHASFTARVAARFVKNAKIIYTRHSVFPASKFVKSKVGNFFYQNVNEYYADKIIAVGKAAKDNLMEGGIHEEKIEVVYNGVEPIKEISEDEKKKLKKKYHIGEEDKVVGIIARLEEVKGHEYFIESAQILLNEFKTKAKFLILGTGSEEEKLKQKVKELKLSDQIIFTGFVKNVGDFLNIMDVQVNCSYGTEATSLSLLEGMSIGVPAVVSSYGGNPDVIQDGENGYVVPQKDARKTAEAIQKILESEEIKEKMKENSMKKYKENYTVQKYTENVQNVYENVNKQPAKKKINLLDIVIILLAIIVGIFGYRFMKRTDNIESDSSTKVVYQVMASSVIPEVGDMIEIGGLLYDSGKNSCLGTITNKEVKPSTRMDTNRETGEFVQTEVTDKVDIILTVEVNAKVTNQNIETGDFIIKVGNKADVKGKGYAMNGYVIKIER